MAGTDLRATLSRAECMALLRTGRVGRVVLTLDALPVVMPVGYRVGDTGIVLRTHADSRLVAAAVNSIVAFQVDSFDDATGTGWSITVTGTTSPLSPSPEALAGLLDVHQPSEQGADCLMVIRPTVVNGTMLTTEPRSTASRRALGIPA